MAIEERNRPWVAVIHLLQEGKRINVPLTDRAARNGGEQVPTLRDRVLVWQNDVYAALADIAPELTDGFNLETDWNKISVGAEHLRSYLRERLGELRGILEESIGWIG